MLSKTSLKLVGSAVALALSAHAFANTTADANGTIFLTINDISQHTEYFFDTGLNITSFSNATTYSHSVAGDPNYTSFINSEVSGDVVEYSLVAGNGTGAKPGTYTIDFTGGSSAPPAAFGSNIYTAWQQVANLTAAIGNPSGGSTFENAAAVNITKWNDGGYEANFNAATANSDAQSIGTPLSFYTETSVNPGSNTIRATESTFSSTWKLDSSGLLTYNVSAVPLPAPLLLLLSGLGSLGVIGRRRTASASGELAGAAV